MKLKLLLLLFCNKFYDIIVSLKFSSFVSILDDSRWILACIYPEKSENYA